MIHVVGTEAGAHQFLKQVRLFVGAFGGAEPCERPLAICIANLAKSFGRGFEGLFPGGFAEDFLPVLGIDNEILALRHTRLADQRLGEAMFVLNVVETVAPLDAEAAGVGGTILSLHIEDGVVLDLVGKLAADAAVRGTPEISLLLGDDFALDVAARASSAPVGQAWTHSPQATQVESPIRSSRSNTIFECPPRLA